MHFSFQDCLFDGVISPEVDAVYANSAICGTLAASYPPPRVTIRSVVSPSCVREYYNLTKCQILRV